MNKDHYEILRKEAEEIGNQIDNQERLEHSAKAFSWLVQNYDIGNIADINGLKVSQVIELVEAVENAIVQTSKDFINERKPQESEIAD